MSYTNYIEFIDGINLIISVIEGALMKDERVSFKVEDYGDAYSFVIVKNGHDFTYADIKKIDDNSFKDIYDAIADKYDGRIEVGATSIYLGDGIGFLWNLAPVIDEKVMIEFVSGSKENQKWVNKELSSDKRKKGLN